MFVPIAQFYMHARDKLFVYTYLKCTIYLRRYNINVCDQ